MGSRSHGAKTDTLFKRKNVLLERREYISNRQTRPARIERRPSNIPEKLQFQEPPVVLIVNASHEMASEITTQLSLQMPECSLIYAPSFEIARWILKRREVSLVVSSAILPDGSIAKLEPQLRSMDNPPDVIVVGDMNLRSAEAFERSGYHFASIRRVAEQGAEPQPEKEQEKIRSLGADIRNDLNNPLQEIVAMAFVAQSNTGQGGAMTGQALDAIEKAAKNMSEVVNGLEEKILNAVRNS